MTTLRMVYGYRGRQVLWLDIEHTASKQYFTWDSFKFPSPLTMQSEVQF